MSEALSDIPLSYKLRGDVNWEAGDTEETYKAKQHAYIHARIQDIAEGKPTWLIRNFDANIGAAYDYFKDKEIIATVIVDENDCGVYDANEGPEGPQPIVRQRGLQLEEAVRIVENYNPASH